MISIDHITTLHYNKENTNSYYWRKPWAIFPNMMSKPSS